MSRETVEIERAPRSVEPVSRVLGAFWGMWIGDALAMPAHQYMEPTLIERDYTILNTYRLPKTPHPGSRVSRNNYTSSSDNHDIVGKQKEFWGKGGTHPHQSLQRGQNTLTLQLATVLFESLVENGGFDFDDYQQRYINFMLKPEEHGDTWVEECHRNFFELYAEGRPPESCGDEDHNMSGLVIALPILIYYAHQPKMALQHARSAVELTHKGKAMSSMVGILAETMSWIFKGENIEEIIYRKIGQQAHPSFQFPFKQWMTENEIEMIGHKLFNRSIITESLPTLTYMALKYEYDPARALMINAHLGGDSCHRGAVLGAILGARAGIEIFPPEWVFELSSFKRLDLISDTHIKRA